MAALALPQVVQLVNSLQYTSNHPGISHLQCFCARPGQGLYFERFEKMWECKLGIESYYLTVGDISSAAR